MHAPPVVSFGLPVRNGEQHLRSILDGLLAQTLHEIEIVICDNASDDNTPEICAAYALQDPRIRFVSNGYDLGQIANFNRVLSLAQGKYFRWIGADDYLEADYAERCASLLDDDPSAVAVTTFQDHTDDAGRRFYREYSGPRVDSPVPHRRFRRMLWFCQSDYLFLDPIYSLIRRDVLLSTRRLQQTFACDRILAAELSIAGPFRHIPACLSHRRLVREPYGEHVWRRYAPEHHERLAESGWRLFWALVSVAHRTKMNVFARAVCYWAAARFASTEQYKASRTRLQAFLKERLGLSRQTLMARLRIPYPRTGGPERRSRWMR